MHICICKPHKAPIFLYILASAQAAAILALRTNIFVTIVSDLLLDISRIILYEEAYGHQVKKYQPQSTIFLPLYT